MLCAQCQRTICKKLPWTALETAAKPQFEMGWRSRYGGAKDLRSLLRSVSGASLIRIGVSTKILEDPFLKNGDAVQGALKIVTKLPKLEFGAVTSR